MTWRTIGRATQRDAGRAEHKVATAIALRRAAIALMTERGYDATSTDDIARAAGVSPRTFFNYFPTKESVVVLPDQLLADLVADALRRRPIDEDTEAALAAAAIDAIETLTTLANTTGGGDEAPMTLAALRLMFRERALRQIFFERRAVTEETVWAVLLERGVDPDDLSARAAAVTFVSLAYLGVRLWVEGEAAESLPDVVAKCLSPVTGSD